MVWIMYYSLLLTISIVLVGVDCADSNSSVVQTISDKKLDEKFVSNIGINGFCDMNENCTAGQVCLDSYCRCKPDHRWDVTRGRCESYNCATDVRDGDERCDTYDPNRRCDHNLPVNLFRAKCECGNGYYEDKRSFKCRKFCFNNHDCDRGLATNASNHMVCVDFLCQCRPNYRSVMNGSAQECQAFNCTKDSDCWTNGDENRECIDGVCECNFQEDMDSTKCYLSLYSLFRPKNYSTRKEGLLLCTIVIIPAIALYCLYSQAKQRRLKRILKQRILEKNQMNINYLYLTKNQEMQNYPQKH